MTVFEEPAAARSDQRAAAPLVVAASSSPVHGAVLSLGAAAWAGEMLVSAVIGPTDAAAVVSAVASGLFQVGLLALLHVLWRTRALGAGGVASGVLIGEAVVLGLALVATVGDATGVSNLDEPVWMLVDLCWPLSMIGMFVIGLRVAVAGVWTGLRRYWTLLATSWAVVTIPVTILAGDSVAQWVAPVHLLTGYTVLGILLARGADNHEVP